MGSELKKLRIVFMGSPDFAIPSLEALVGSRHEIIAVVSGSDKRRGRGNELMPTVVKKRALELGLSVVEADNMKDPDFAIKLKSLHADLFVVVAFKILPPDVLAIPKIGSVNLHASLLPRYRGAAPIHRAVMNGDTETGVTVFFLDEKIDTGNFILQERVSIGEEETTGDVYNKLMHLGADAIVRAVNEIATGDYELIPQNDNDATSAPKIYQEDAFIQLNNQSKDIINLVRGMNPFPVAWMILDGKKLKVFKARIPMDELELLSSLGVVDHGSLKVDSGRLFAMTHSGLIELLDVQIEGKRRTTGEEFVRGYTGKMLLTDSF